jgi:hypothetical protein
MKQVIRLTESDLHNIIKESVKKILKETDCAGVMQTGCGEAPKGTNPEAGQYTVACSADKETADRTPGFSVNGKADWNSNPGNVQRREIYNAKAGKKKVRESISDEDWEDYEAEDNYLIDRYSEDYGREDPTYQMQKNDYHGIVSMLKMHGYDAEIEDNDPEGIYPPMLTIYNKDNNSMNLVSAINMLSDRGWVMNRQFSGEPTRRGTAYVFQPMSGKI